MHTLHPPMKFSLVAKLLPALLLALCPGLAFAQAYVAVSNLAVNPPSSTNTISAIQWTGSSFTTDNSAAAFTLNSITLRMMDAQVNNIFFAGFRVSIYTNGGDNRPGTELAGYVAAGEGDGEPVTAGDYIYSFSANLAANTTYWTVVSVQAPQPDGIYKANLVFNTNTDAGSTWLLNKYSISSDSGATWGFASNGGLLMSVEATASAIPEPSTYAMLAGLGALGLAMVRRRVSPKPSTA